MNNTPTPMTETDLFEATKVSLEYGNQRLFKKSQSTRIVGEVAFSDGYEYALKHSSKIKQLERELAAVTEQRDGLRSGIDYASDQLTAVTEQRDRQAEALEQWQPIETAPKDRSFILSAHPEHGYLITRWLGAREMWDGWAIEPTHWMSLPKLTTP